MDFLFFHTVKRDPIQGKLADFTSLRWWQKHKISQRQNNIASKTEKTVPTLDFKTTSFVE